LIDSQITALGQTPGGVGSGPPGGGTSACPGGDDAAAQLIPTISFLSRLLESEGIYFFFRHDTAGHVLVAAGAPGALALAGVFDIANGAPEGEFALSLAGSTPVLYILHPSGTAGVATIACTVCSP
jgi:hypothetical protein